MVSDKGDTDSRTFVTSGSVLQFYVDIKGDDKARIEALILEGGGEVCDYKKSVIVITSKKFAASDSKIFLPPAYVEDSIAYGQQVFQDYALRMAADVDSFAGRVHYSQADDSRIISYVNSHPNFKITGNTLWQQMESDKVTDHSWHSMRAHYLKVLLPKTKNGNVTLTKKKKSSTDNESNMYSAYSNTKTTNESTKPTSNKEEETQSPVPESENGSNFTPDGHGAGEMEDLLEHLLNADSPSKSSQKSTKQSKKSHKDSSPALNNTANKHSTPINTPANNSHTHKTPTSTSTTRSIQTPSTNFSFSSTDLDVEEFVHKPSYSQGKKRAAMEKNMRGSAKKLRIQIEHMAQELQLPVVVVYHAYLMHSGDPVKAWDYLTAADDEQVSWLPSEDNVLTGSNNNSELQKVINLHGKDNCMARTDFLDSGLEIMGPKK